MTQLSEVMTLPLFMLRDIDQMQDKYGNVAKGWEAWCALVSKLCLAIASVLNPDVIALGGGLSKMRQVAHDLSAQKAQKQFEGFQRPYCSRQRAKHQAKRALQPMLLSRKDAMTDNGRLFIKPIELFDGHRLRFYPVIRRSDYGR